MFKNEVISPIVWWQVICEKWDIVLGPPSYSGTVYSLHHNRQKNTDKNKSDHLPVCYITNYTYATHSHPSKAIYKHTFIRVYLLVATQSTAAACCPINDDEAQAHYHKQHAQSSKTGSLRKGEKHSVINQIKCIL